MGEAQQIESCNKHKCVKTTKRTTTSTTTTTTITTTTKTTTEKVTMTPVSTTMVEELIQVDIPAVAPLPGSETTETEVIEELDDVAPLPFVISKKLPTESIFDPIVDDEIEGSGFIF